MDYTKVRHYNLQEVSDWLVGNQHSMLLDKLFAKSRKRLALVSSRLCPSNIIIIIIHSLVYQNICMFAHCFNDCW